MSRISFITDDKKIHSQLVTLGHTESQNTREDLLRFIPDNFCRKETDLANSLKLLVTNKDTTVIFVNGGHEILGMTVLNSSHSTHLMLEVICVPESEKKKGIGTMLLDCVKELAKRMQLLVVLLVLYDSLEPFYVKQGFVKDPDDEDYYIFNPSGGGKKARKSRKVRRSRNARKLGRCTRARRDH